jgi:hypothetical protein
MALRQSQVSRQQQIIEQLILKEPPLDELYITLGENADPDLGFSEKSLEEKKSIGLAWWKKNAIDIKKVVCPIICNDKAADALVKDVVQAILALFGAKYGVGTITYAAVIALRHCANGWCDNE